VEEGKFREDLFFRLYVVVIHLPALRDRAEDIPLLAQHFLKAFAQENNRSIESISPEAMDLLTAYPWPGNVRELRNAIERMIVLARGHTLTARELPVAIREMGGGTTPAVPSKGRLSMEEAEKQLIVRALRAHDGNRTKAAQDLGISRRTLHRKLNEYGLHES
jgi:two-component system response regulator HydG